MRASLDEMKGARVVSVDATTVCADVIMSDGRTFCLRLYGECCSVSTFTDPKQFDDLVGATIFDAENREGQSTNNTPPPAECDVLSWHFLVFTTSKGHITIDWHNDSNGYYDGELTVDLRTPADGSSSP